MENLNKAARNNYAFFLFISAILFPFYLSFLLPLIYSSFFGLMSIHHYQYLSWIDLLKVFLLINCWLGVIFFIASWPGKIKVKAIDWKESTTYYFMLLTTPIGILALWSLLDALLPLSLMRFVYFGSYLIPINIGLGIYLLAIKKSVNYKRKIISGVLLVNSLSAVLLPLMNGQSSFIVLVSITSVYSFFFVKKRGIIQAILFILLIATVFFFSVLVKHSVRLNQNFIGSTLENPFHFNKKKFFTQSLFIGHNDYLKKIEKDQYSHFLLTFPGYIISRIVKRVDHLSEFAYVISQTPDNIPYLSNKSYSLIPYIFLPRLLFPDKPIFDLPHFYGHRYNFIQPEDRVTFWAITIPIEGWINFGWWGLIGSAVIFGFILRFLYLFMLGASWKVGNFIFTIVMIFVLAGLEGYAYLILGNLFYAMLFFGGLVFIVKLIEKRF